MDLSSWGRESLPGMVVYSKVNGERESNVGVNWYYYSNSYEEYWVMFEGKKKE